MIEKILEKLGELITESYYASVKGTLNAGVRNNAYHEAKKIVQEVAAEYNNGWIPVEDRLPDNNIDVEVTLANGKRHICWYSGLRQEWIDAVSDDESALNVIAWKEPSEPYKPKGE